MDVTCINIHCITYIALFSQSNHVIFCLSHTPTFTHWRPLHPWKAISSNSRAVRNKVSLNESSFVKNKWLKTNRTDFVKYKNNTSIFFNYFIIKVINMEYQNKAMACPLRRVFCMRVGDGVSSCVHAFNTLRCPALSHVYELHAFTIRACPWRPHLDGVEGNTKKRLTV